MPSLSENTIILTILIKDVTLQDSRPTYVKTKYPSKQMITSKRFAVLKGNLRTASIDSLRKLHKGVGAESSIYHFTMFRR